MKERQNILLKNIIKQYIKNAQPVGSKKLSNIIKPTISSATIRNEMADLIKKGYLVQPHLSAGRIPSLKGWQYYVENLLEEKDFSSNELEELKDIRDILKKKNNQDAIKVLIKELAELTKELSFIAFDKDSFYYTGLTNLFNQPEFKEQNLVYRISQVIDHLDRILEKNFDFFNKELKVLIGSKNPFSEKCGAILTMSDYGLIGVLGPVRMNYQKNLGHVKKVCKLINQI